MPRLFVATRKGLFTIDRTASGWAVGNVRFLGDNCSLVMPDPRDQHVYVALGHGHFGVKMHRSRDGGATWEPCAAPAYPPKPAEVPDVMDPFHNRPIPWSLELVWALAPGGADQPGALWCGTIPGGLFRSDDRAESWHLNRPLWDHPKRAEWFGGGADLPGIHSICVDPRDSRRVAVGVSCGGVWLSTDGGQSWNCRADGMRAAYMPPERAYDPAVQDPHCLVQCRSKPDHYWVQHHNGIFRCADNLASWHEIADVKPSAFGFPVAVHPDDPDTAWFVPATSDERRIPVDGRVVVTRTRDGGRTFDVLRDGLPQQHAYDITFRHALDVDATGRCLAFGTTTGALFVSENQGDSWQAVSAHLPPVYCVRFGAA